jgi:hypothetical protein
MLLSFSFFLFPFPFHFFFKKGCAGMLFQFAGLARVFIDPQSYRRCCCCCWRTIGPRSVASLAYGAWCSTEDRHGKLTCWWGLVSWPESAHRQHCGERVCVLVPTLVTYFGHRLRHEQIARKHRTYSASGAHCGVRLTSAQDWSWW